MYNNPQWRLSECSQIVPKKVPLYGCGPSGSGSCGGGGNWSLGGGGGCSGGSGCGGSSGSCGSGGCGGNGGCGGCGSNGGVLISSGGGGCSVPFDMGRRTHRCRSLRGWRDMSVVGGGCSGGGVAAIPNIYQEGGGCVSGGDYSGGGGKYVVTNVTSHCHGARAGAARSGWSGGDNNTYEVSSATMYLGGGGTCTCFKRTLLLALVVTCMVNPPFGLLALLLACSNPLNSSLAYSSI